MIGGKVASFDDKESKKISGVSYVGKIGDSAVAVVADSVWGAMEGRRVLNVTWDEGPNKDLNTAAVMASLKQASRRRRARACTRPAMPRKASGRKISAEYALPFMAHAPMEPGNCTAHYQGTKCELWAPTQVPQDCRDSVAHGDRSRSRSGESERHADGRRIWPATGARLRGRSRAGVEGDQRVR